MKTNGSVGVCGVMDIGEIVSLGQIARADQLVEHAAMPGRLVVLCHPPPTIGL